MNSNNNRRDDKDDFPCRKDHDKDHGKECKKDCDKDHGKDNRKQKIFLCMGELERIRDFSENRNCRNEKRECEKPKDCHGNRRREDLKRFHSGVRWHA